VSALLGDLNRRAALWLSSGVSRGYCLLTGHPTFIWVPSNCSPMATNMISQYCYIIFPW
jgi:hypothetical protein